MQLLNAGAVVATMLSMAAGTAGVAQAQLRQPRSFRGLFQATPPADPNRNSQTLTLAASILGGVDDAAGQEIVGQDEQQLVSEAGYSGLAQVSLQYWRGRSSRSFSASAYTGAVTYSTIDKVLVPEVGFNVSGSTAVGRSSSLNAAQSVSYQPYYTLGGFNGLSGDLPYVGPPDAVSSYGVLDYASWMFTSTAGLSHRWGRSHSSNARYAFSGRTYVNESKGDSWAHRASVSHSVSLGQNWSAGGGYGYSHSEYELIEDQQQRRPFDGHDVHGSLSYDRRLSPSRQFSTTFGAGAAYARTSVRVPGEDLELERQYWKPTYFVSASLDTWRYWSLWANYRRSFNVLNAVNFDTYYADMLAVGTGGLVGRRVSLWFVGGISSGESLYGEGERRDYETYVFSAQTQYALTRNAAVTGRYYYYSYDLGRSAAQLPGLPSRLDRQGAQVGISFWLPLIGRSGRSAP